MVAPFALFAVLSLFLATCNAGWSSWSSNFDNAIIVLGQRLNDDGSLRQSCCSRIDKGIDLLLQNPSSVLILSGGNTNGACEESEAKCMLKYIKRKYNNKSIKYSNIILEEESSNTIENCLNCQKIMKERNIIPKSIKVITSDYHVYRTKCIFQAIMHKNNATDIPQRFIDGCDGNLVEARSRWERTLKFRETDRLDGILSEKQPFFNVILDNYPHYNAGRGKLGQICYYERPGDLNYENITANGVNVEKLLRHWLFFTEYQWNVLGNGEEQAKSIAIIDVHNVKIRDLAGDKLSFLQQAIENSNKHYPERCYCVLIVNAPSYFCWIWGIVRPFIDANTQKKVRILSSKETLQGMQELIDIKHIPVYYGGQLDYGSGIDSCRFDSPETKNIKEFVKNIMSNHQFGKRKQVNTKKSNELNIEYHAAASHLDRHVYRRPAHREKDINEWSLLEILEKEKKGIKLLAHTLHKYGNYSLEKFYLKIQLKSLKKFKKALRRRNIGAYIPLLAIAVSYIYKRV